MTYEDALNILSQEKPVVPVVVAQELVEVCELAFNETLQAYYKQEQQYAQDRLMPDGLMYEDAVLKLQQAKHRHKIAQHARAKSLQLLHRMEDLRLYQHSL